MESVPRYIEENGERLRSRYLAFIHDLGEAEICGKPVVDHLDIGDDFSYWWMTHLAEKSPFKSPGIYSCMRLLALEEILRERNPADLTFHSPDGKEAEAVRILCRNLGIAYSWHKTGVTGPNWSLRRLYRLLPHFVRALIIFAMHLATRWRLRRVRLPNWSGGHKAIFMCSYFIHLDPILCAQGQFHSRQWEVLPQYLNEKGWRANWIQHFLTSKVVPDVGTGLSWLEKFNADPDRQGRHCFLDCYLTWHVVWRTLKDWLRLVWRSWQLRQIQEYFRPRDSRCSFWPILRDEWRSSIGGTVAIGNCLWVALFDSVMSRMPRQGLGLYLCENQGWERAFLHAWRRHGHGRIIAVPHATVPFWHLYYFDDARSLASRNRCGMPQPDVLAVNGAMARRAFTEAGYPSSKMVDVEALRYMKLTTSDKNPHTRKMAMPPLGKVNVLILGELLPASMNRLLELVQAAAKNLPDGYQFTFKPHPGYSVDLSNFANLEAKQTTEALDLILQDYDVAISANSTSAAVDAYISGLPVIVGLDGSDLNLSPLRGQTDVSFVGTPDELVSALLKVKESTPQNFGKGDIFFLDEKLPRWSSLLQKYGAQ